MTDLDLDDCVTLEDLEAFMGVVADIAAEPDDSLNKIWNDAERRRREAGR